jgi:plasmid stabilization system protein ParE
MFPIRQHGLMEGYRYFITQDVLFYYSVASREVRVVAIIPGQMEQA